MVNEWFMKGTAVQKLAEQLGSVKSALEQLSRERGGSVFTWRRDREIALEATKLHATFPELTEPQHWSIGVKAMGYVVRLANHLPLERLRPIAHDAVNAKISVRDLELIWDDVRLLGAGGPSRIRRGRRPNKGDVEPTEQNGIQVENRVAVALRRTLPRVLKYDSMVRVVRPRRKISPSPDLVIVGAVDGECVSKLSRLNRFVYPKMSSSLTACCQSGTRLRGDCNSWAEGQSSVS